VQEADEIRAHHAAMLDVLPAGGLAELEAGL